MKESWKQGFWNAPSVLMDWAACVFVLWLLSIQPHWIWALYYMGLSFVGYLIRAAITISRDQATARTAAK